MADLTVLFDSPAPIPGLSQDSTYSPRFSFVHRNAISRPVSPVSRATVQPIPLRPNSTDDALLSPPLNTWRSRPRHSLSPVRSASAPPTSSTFDESGSLTCPAGPQRRSTCDLAKPASTKGGELVRPPPPLLRPTTFWRKTRRSGVTAASYSPSSHLIRRSTFVAAGLSLESPVADLSAFGVESRVEILQLLPDNNPQ